MAENITPKQTRAIAALLRSGTVAEAAQQAGVGERTVYTWLGEPAFNRALLEAEGEVITLATRQLLSIQPRAIAEIERIMVDEAAPASVRLRAAQVVLDYVLKLRELRNIEQRLAELEQAVYGN